MFSELWHASESSIAHETFSSPSNIPRKAISDSEIQQLLQRHCHRTPLPLQRQVRGSMHVKFRPIALATQLLPQRHLQALLGDFFQALLFFRILQITQSLLSGRTPVQQLSILRHSRINFWITSRRPKRISMHSFCM